MGLFSFSKKDSYLGVDLGTNSVKIVELRNEKGRARLVTYGFVEQQTDIVRSSSKDDEKKIVKILKTICDKARTGSIRVISALPSFSVFTSIIHLPQMNKNDLAQAIQWEAKKFIPLPLEEMRLDWKIIDQSVTSDFKNKKVEDQNKVNNKDGLTKMDGKGDNVNLGDKEVNAESEETSTESVGGDIKVLLIAAPKDLVQRYVDIFKQADLELASLETEAFALERSLVGADPSPIMIMDIGDISTDIVVVERGVPLLNRSIDVGGGTLTKTIMNSLQIDQNRAEQFKKDIGFMSNGDNNIPKAVESAISPIINEVKYCLDLYQQQTDSHKIEKVVLAGGSSFLPHLPNYLFQVLNIKVIIGDPWARVIYPLELQSVLKELGPRFAVAIGLAMREIE